MSTRTFFSMVRLCTVGLKSSRVLIVMATRSAVGLTIIEAPAVRHCIGHPESSVGLVIGGTSEELCEQCGA